MPDSNWDAVPYFPWPRTAQEWGNYLNGALLPLDSNYLLSIVRQILDCLAQREQEEMYWKQRSETMEAELRYGRPPVSSYETYRPAMPFDFDPEPTIPKPSYVAQGTFEKEESEVECKPRKRIIKFEE